MQRGKMTPYIEIKGKHQHLDRARTRNEPLVHSSQPYSYHHPYSYPKQFLSTWTKEKGNLPRICMHLFIINCKYSHSASFFSFISLKDGSLSGKKKSERKARQLLTDLPLPPELPGGMPSPHSPPEDKKSQTLRRRPKYVAAHLAPHRLSSCYRLLCIH